MSVKGPVSPLSSGAEALEPLDSKERLQKANGSFAKEIDRALENAATEATSGAADSPTLQGLKDIATSANFLTEQQTEAAIRESARFMIKSRIKEKFQEQDGVTEMLDELSEFVTKDPLLHRKLKNILERLKNK